MSLRVGIDMDGTLADLSSIYHEYEQALFGKSSKDPAADEADAARALTDKERIRAAKEATKRQEVVWRALQHTPNLWMQLQPIEADVIGSLHAAATAHNWEVFFITQRPKADGASVQLQTQRWLVAQGFDMPSVLTLTGSRGKAVNALDLDFLIDDLPRNCIDVISESRCRPILVLRQPDAHAEATVRRMSIGVVRSVAEAIDMMVQPQNEPRETMISRILGRLGLSR